MFLCVSVILVLSQTIIQDKIPKYVYKELNILVLIVRNTQVCLVNLTDYIKL